MGFPLDSRGDFLAREIVMRRSRDVELKHLHAPERRPDMHSRRLASMELQGCSDDMMPPPETFFLLSAFAFPLTRLVLLERAPSLPDPSHGRQSTAGLLCRCRSQPSLAHCRRL